MVFRGGRWRLTDAGRKAEAERARAEQAAAEASAESARASAERDEARRAANVRSQADYRRRAELAIEATRRRRNRLASVPNDLTPAEWRQVKARWGHRCAYCGRPSQRLTQDHVVPIVAGGAHSAANVVPACRSCNARKGVGPAPPFAFDPDAGPAQEDR